MSQIFRSKKGQGTTEYIVILSVAVLFLVGVFWSRIKPILTGKVNEIGVEIQKAK
jgi:hypothetical protein